MIIVKGVVLSVSHTVSLFTTVRAKPADKNASIVLIKVKTTASDDKLVNVAAVTPESAGGSISITRSCDFNIGLYNYMVQSCSGFKVFSFITSCSLLATLKNKFKFAQVVL
jgi:hypothetical protein